MWKVWTKIFFLISITNHLAEFNWAIIAPTQIKMIAQFNIFWFKNSIHCIEFSSRKNNSRQRLQLYVHGSKCTSARIYFDLTQKFINTADTG